MKKLSSTQKLSIACGVMQVVSGLFLAGCYLLIHNTLRANGRWSSTKAELGKGVIGSRSYFYGRQALSGNRLHLNAWNGYQEVLYREKVLPDQIGFDFRLGPKSYLVFEYGCTENQFRGLRLSLYEKLPTQYFEADVDGKFQVKKPFAAKGLRPGRWHHLEAVFSGDSVQVSLDGSEIGPFPGAGPAPARFGFRGGARPAEVDNAVVRSRGGGTIREDFGNWRHWPVTVLVAVLLVAALSALLAFLVRRFSRLSPENVGHAMVMVHLTLTAVCAIFYVYQLQSGKYYPKVDAELKARDYLWRKSLAEEIARKIREKYGTVPDPSKRRILFIGTSQTWGSGATDEAHTFVKRTEDALNERIKSPRKFQCINSGISGESAPTLLKFYEKEWSNLGLEVAVINLSNNDYWQVPFVNSLIKMVKISRSKGIKPLFVLEANSSEREKSDLEEKHEKMRWVAQKMSVPIVDMNAYLSAREDDGFLWRDFVHLSNYGQELVAEKMFEEIKALLAPGGK